MESSAPTCHLRRAEPHVQGLPCRRRNRMACRQVASSRDRSCYRSASVANPDVLIATQLYLVFYHIRMGRSTTQDHVIGSMCSRYTCTMVSKLRSGNEFFPPPRRKHSRRLRRALLPNLYCLTSSESSPSHYQQLQQRCSARWPRSQGMPHQSSSPCCLLHHMMIVITRTVANDSLGSVIVIFTTHKI